MLFRGCEFNLVIYSILISVLCREGKVEDVLNMLKVMVEQGLKFDNYSYDLLILVFCKEGKL